jgi:hypothetical protein
MRGRRLGENHPRFPPTPMAHHDLAGKRAMATSIILLQKLRLDTTRSEQITLLEAVHIDELRAQVRDKERDLCRTLLLEMSLLPRETLISRRNANPRRPQNLRQGTILPHRHHLLQLLILCDNSENNLILHTSHV